jgi:hypothetical protein
MLHELAGNLRASARRQGAQFIQRFLGAEIGRITSASTGNASGVIASRLSAGSDRSSGSFWGAAARAKLDPDKKRAFPAFRWIQH